MRLDRAARYGFVLLSALTLSACASAPPLKPADGHAIVAALRERVARQGTLRPIVVDYGPTQLDDQGVQLPVKLDSKRWSVMLRSQREQFLHDFGEQLQKALYSVQPQPPRNKVTVRLADDLGKSIGWVAVGGSEEGYAFEGR